MTPTDLETLRGLVQILREYEGRIACGNAAWDADDWSNYNKFQYEADHLLNSFTRKASKSTPALTALLADYERMQILARFALAVLHEHRPGDPYEIGDVDGGWLQDALEDFGILELRSVTEPCSDNCFCADNGELPTNCYFVADWVNALRATLKGEKV